MNVRSNAAHHVMKTSSAHRADQKAAQSKVAMIEKLQAFFDELTKTNDGKKSHHATKIARQLFVRSQHGLLCPHPVVDILENQKRRPFELSSFWIS